VKIDGRLRGPLIESPTFVLMQAGRLALEWAAEALELLELSVAQFAALALIRRFGTIGQSALAEWLGLSQAGMSTLASGLERDGLIERRPHMWDGRQRVLCVTRAGVELLAEAADELAAVDAQFLDRVGEDAVKALGELAPPNLNAVEQALRAAGWD
jgi:DNA-binding MarR family transcriptional regulator